MPASALANALKDFGVRSGRGAEPFAMASPHAEPAFEPPAFEGNAAFEAVDMDALVGQAVAEAEAALTERLTAEHAEALQAEQARHAGEVAELNRHFAEEASERIAASIQTMEDRVVVLTSAVAARILGMALTDDVRQRSIERLGETISEAIHDNEAVRVRVRGSQPLYEALKAALPQHAEHLDFTESVSFDLTVTIDDSVFETRMAEWSAALSEALA